MGFWTACHEMPHGKCPSESPPYTTPWPLVLWLKGNYQRLSSLLWVATLTSQALRASSAEYFSKLIYFLKCFSGLNCFHFLFLTYFWRNTRFELFSIQAHWECKYSLSWIVATSIQTILWWSRWNRPKYHRLHHHHHHHLKKNRRRKCFPERMLLQTCYHWGGHIVSYRVISYHVWWSGSWHYM